MSRLKRLIQEIHRRSLWQVLGIYLVGARVAFQGIEALASGLGPSHCAGHRFRTGDREQSVRACETGVTTGAVIGVSP